MGKSVVAAVALAASGLFFAAPAMAEGGCDPVMTINALQGGGATTNPKTICFSQMDIDGDGLISASEWDEFQEKMFKNADADESGGVSVEEINKLQDHY